MPRLIKPRPGISMCMQSKPHWHCRRHSVPGGGARARLQLQELELKALLDVVLVVVVVVRFDYVVL